MGGPSLPPTTANTTARRLVSLGVMLLARVGGGEFALLPALALIGRDRHCDLVLHSEHTSTRHAEIRGRPGGWEARDLGSRNGTSLDGARLAPGVPVLLPVG